MDAAKRRALLPVLVVVAVPFGLAGLVLWGARLGWYGAEAGIVVLAAATAGVLAPLVRRRAPSSDTGGPSRDDAAAALRESEDRLRAVLDNANALVYLKDLDGRLLFINRRCEEVFHVPRGHALGRKYDDFFPGEVADALRAHDAQVLASGAPLEFEELAADDDGLHTYVSVKFPLVDSRGATYGLCGISTDITARKRIETALEQRTRELEAANDALASFAYSVSHDLRTPLRAINGYAKVLIEDHAAEVDAEARHLLADIADNASHMGRLIDDLLTFSRLGRSEIAKTSVDVTALVRDVVDELRRLEPERVVTVAIGDLLPVRADGSMLRQVLANLIGNAWKFTRDRATARIEVGCRRTADEAIYFVKDDGAGFDMQYAGKLFGVFQRLHRHDEFDGTGVGLAIVQRVVQRHGGRVWGEGEVGRGATFSFALPLDDRRSAA